MRTLSVLVLFVAGALAGCISDTPTEPTPATGSPIEGLPDLAALGFELRNSHPDYRFPTNSDLPEGAILPPTGQNNSHPGIDVWYTVEHPGLPDPLASIDFGARTDGVPGANGIAVLGNLAFVGPGSGPLHIVDISDPLNPNVIGVAEVPARDIDTILFPDGRLILVSTGGGSVMYFTDATDPWNPFLVSTIETPNGNHNIAVVPGSPIVYNSPSDGRDTGVDPAGLVNSPLGSPAGETDIIDLSVPEEPVFVRSWANGYGCHDVAFLVNNDVDKQRGYCAGLEKVQIWDISNATDPSIVVEFGWPLGGVHDTTSASIASFAHLAIPNHDGTVLILGDETGGGAAPGCDFSTTTPTGQTVTGPLGNIWFYDVSDETTPILKGSVSPSATDQRPTPGPFPLVSCTAHFGKVVEDTPNVVMGFYTAGVLLVNFEDLDNPVIVDRYEQPTPVTGEGTGAGSIWDVWYHQGYLVTGDAAHGLDVLTLA